MQVAERKTRHGNFIAPIPLVDDLTHILIEAGKNKLHSNVAIQRILHHGSGWMEVARRMVDECLAQREN
jgi:hypothetical protein